jgi:hypothetical protein
VIYLNILARGCLIWLVPFLVSFGFYTPSGELTSSYALFKSAMVLTLTWTTLAVNLVRPPRALPPWMVAAAYLLINVALDALVLVPLMGLTAAAYVEQIGLVYLIIPSLTVVLLRSPVLSGPAEEKAPASSLSRG